ncbi:N-acetyl-gamma-glutamyl-phosphate reductase [Thermogutta terrifontis]|jgi:N-acetyl-gamma-glutamyl-phosphate reductase|uniref:N-acetyl-gamma-glutamyl-phosphate reductase n=1 Tax=Thermogutta terrifontis TaxID=1331910 RepID=A0A286RM58_9BACT|nr:N-acetyl-gamma-glutamyl-phosphate reductase [Thermogutta terrifontis]ASV77054.1 N-acetyl-gamma-glutamyl-phosphate reductase [Thermogutta terrifontis]
MAIRVAILGATGYTAVELIKILLRHPEVTITALTSRQEGNAPIASVHPTLVGRISANLENLTPAEVAARAECVFSCLPHCASAEVIPELLKAGCRVVDFSADYRLNSPQVYEEWYGHRHPDPERLGKVPYGLPELFREEIRGASLVANPGCYPTSVILALAPLLKAGLIEPRDIIVDSKSGVSGAGRTPKLTTHFPECNESLSAYNVGRHRHQPEIEQVLGQVAGSTVEVVFTPHLVPMDRGILTTTYSRPTRQVSEDEVLDCLESFYQNEPFVQVVDHLPATKDTAGTNFCHITARIVRDRIVTVSCLDNLVKGASGAAVQNFNLMYGFPETTALL